MRRRRSPLNRERRAVLHGMGSFGLLALTGCASKSDAPDRGESDKALADALAGLEKSCGGRLGVGVLDTKDGWLAGHRLDDHFTMCSTFKFSLAAAVLARIDAGLITPGAMLPITKSDVIGHAPEVQAALEKGEADMNVLALAEAAQVQSDNGAANILLQHIGGPRALTAFWRSVGDRVSRLDHYEPELNTSHDGNLDDTTVPGAMAFAVYAILTRPVLKPATRERLVDWMEATQTGLNRIRGGLPKDWRTGDKTGTMNGAAYADKVNDIGIIWHPGRSEPFTIAAFLESSANGSKGVRPEDEAVLAEVGRIAARWMEARTS